jgi:hypothetical protein
MIGYVSMYVVEGQRSGSTPANRSFFHHRPCCDPTVPELLRLHTLNIYFLARRLARWFWCGPLIPCPYESCLSASIFFIFFLHVVNPKQKSHEFFCFIPHFPYNCSYPRTSLSSFLHYICGGYCGVLARHLQSSHSFDSLSGGVWRISIDRNLGRFGSQAGD